MSGLTARPASTETETERALAEFLDQGYCLLEGGVTGERLARLRQGFLEHFEAKRRRWGIRPAGPPDNPEEGSRGVYGKGGNHDYNRWNALLPSTPLFLANDLLANPRALGVLEGIRKAIGDDRRWVLNLLGADINLPDSSDQLPHRDGAELVVTLNCPLIDVREDHGPLEVWPNTHRRPGEAFGLEPMAISLEEWSELQRGPSRRLTVPAGTFILRDHRMLHRGTANRSSEVRPMLSLYLSLMGPNEEVAYRSLVGLGSRIGRLLRHAAPRIPFAEPVQRHVLLANGAALGLAMIYLAGSDRFGHRSIPRAIWDSLDAPARDLLRFATVDGVVAEAYRRHRSAGRTKEACDVVARTLVRAAKRLASPPQVPAG